MFETLFEMFSRLPKQGPGLDETTREVFRSLPLANKDLKVLDVGCGTGAQSLVLAEEVDGKVTSSDVHQPYLDILMARARERGIADRITPLCKSMDELDFPDGSFDLIWAEGSIFVIGFEKGLRQWHRFLKPRGCLVCSDITWFKPNPPEELTAYWESIQCQVLDETTSGQIAEDAGYEVLATKRLDPHGWWEQYYTPFEELAPSWKEEASKNPELAELIKGFYQEIEMFRKYSEYYGYTFYILRNKG